MNTQTFMKNVWVFLILHSDYHLGFLLDLIGFQYDVLLLSIFFIVFIFCVEEFIIEFDDLRR